eukprot:192380_1
MTSTTFGKLKLKTQDENRYGKIIHSGFLNKRSKGKSWTKRYAVLWEDMGLRFYETDDRGNVVGKIKMKHINEIRRLSAAQCNELNPNSPHLFSILSTSLKKTWEFGCDNGVELSEWVHILQSALTIKRESDQSEIEKERETEDRQDASPNARNMYIGHHGHNLSNMEDFSIAQSMSSRVSSIQSLSALAILSGALDDDMMEEHPPNGARTRNSVINDIINEEEEDDDEEQEEQLEEEDEQEDDMESETQKIDASLIKQIEDRLTAENTNIVFEGHLERKTNQKVLGKHLWETRYFRLSTHSLSIFTNDKINIAESVIKLSSIISVNRNTRNMDGNDLKTNRFDINTKHKTLNLRTENQTKCQQWVHFLSCERKKHRKSIRTNLKSIETLKHRKFKSNTQTKKAKTKAPRRRFKRQKTSRDVGVVDENYHDMDSMQEDNDGNIENETNENHKKDEQDDTKEDQHEDNNDGIDEFDENYVAPTIPKVTGATTTRKNRVHSRNLSMKSWASDIEQRHHKNSIANITNMNMKKTRNSVSITKPESFEGFLIRKIGHNSDKIGEKIYFRLSDDTLEFSKIDQMIVISPENELSNDEKNKMNSLHSSNILGTISVEHIKTVEMIENPNGNEDEFVITFNSNTDWILKTEKNDTGNAIKWVNVLQRAQKEAKDITKTINNDKGDDSDSDSQQGTIKALQKMINDETIEELEMARNHELNHTKTNLDKGFEINSLENKNSNLHTQPNNYRCSCFCLR